MFLLYFILSHFSVYLYNYVFIFSGFIVNILFLFILSAARLGQPDLLDIGDDVVIDAALIRPFALESGHFTLMPIKIGDRCCIGVKCSVSPGAVLPSDTCLGPLSSSHELDGAESYNRNFCRPTYLSPPFQFILFIGVPVFAVVLAVSLVPWYFILKLMVYEAEREGWYAKDIHNIYHAFLWWVTPQRIGYYFLLRVIRRCLVPPVRLAVVIAIKRLIIGRFQPMEHLGRSTGWQRFKPWLMSRLLAGGTVNHVTRLIGTHYEVHHITYGIIIS